MLSLGICLQDIFLWSYDSARRKEKQEDYYEKKKYTHLPVLPYCLDLCVFLTTSVALVCQSLFCSADLCLLHLSWRTILRLMLCFTPPPIDKLPLAGEIRRGSQEHSRLWGSAVAEALGRGTILMSVFREVLLSYITQVYLSCFRSSDGDPQS